MPYSPPDSTSSAITGVLQHNKDYLVLHCLRGNIAHCVLNHTSVTVILYGFMQCICSHYKYASLPTTKTDAQQVGQCQWSSMATTWSHYRSVVCNTYICTATIASQGCESSYHNSLQSNFARKSNFT